MSNNTRSGKAGSFVKKQMSIDGYAARIARKEISAFESLYEQLNKLVYSVSFSVLKDRYLAEDITQETFQTVWDKSDQFRGKGFKTWILTIAKNKSLNLLKKRSKDTLTDFNENSWIGGDYSINEKIESSNILDIIATVLSQDEREIVMLKNSGVKMKEIAQLLNQPRGTISWKYSQALEKLKNFIKED